MIKVSLSFGVLLLLAFVPINTLFAENLNLTSLQGKNSSSGLARLKSTSARPLYEAKGWGHMAQAMARAGVSQEQITAILNDPRIPKRDNLMFNIPPREPQNIYRGINSSTRRARAINFYRQNKTVLDKASSEFQVPKEVILAIILVETNCGQYFGKSPVFYRLLRLAAASTPENITAAYQANKSKNPKITLQEVVNRAKWLEKIFLPQAIATFKIAKDYGEHPLTLKGSVAGAIGLPQFLPGNQDLYGVDYNKDGKINLFQPGDAVFSVANFLKQHGWTQMQLPKQTQREVIRHYNRSDPYIDTVLNVARDLRPSL